jgi:hypothetical protein
MALEMKNKQLVLDYGYLRSQLSYNAETGEFYWLIPGRGRQLNKKAGHKNANDGYYYISLYIKGKYYKYYAHRVAWLYVNGSWPSAGIDHIDRDKTNNCISNLREATQLENNRNRTKQKTSSSKYIGVHLENKSKKWSAQIRMNNKRVRLGRFSTEEEAALAYNRAALARDPAFHSLNVIPDSIG